MQHNRFPSLLVSLCLHLGLLALVLWSPVGSSLPDLSQSGPMITGMVTIGAPGKSVPGSVEKIPEPAKGPDESPQPITAPPPPKAEDTPPPPPTKTETPPEPVKTKVEEPQPDAVPIPKEPEKPKEEPKKEEPKPKEEPKEEPKKEEPKPKEEPKKEEPKKSEKPKNDKKTSDKNKKSSVDDALNDLVKQTGTPSGSKKGQGSVKSGKDKQHSSADAALNDLARQIGGAGSDASGRGPGGSGGHGMGRRGSYEQSIVASVRPNWTAVKRADGKRLSTSVRIAIGTDGAILGAQIVSSSGDKAFDDMIMYAIRKTRTLEPPQSPDQQDVVIRFTP